VNFFGFPNENGRSETTVSNEQKYLNAFMEALEATAEEAPTLVYGESKLWDSVGHMALIAALEDAFDIMMEMDDIIDLSSFDKGKEILRKYAVEI
jgi:acyl carrier protein